MNRFWLALGLAGFVLGGLLGAWSTARLQNGRLEAMRLEQVRCSDAGQALASRLALQNGQVEALEQAARQRAESAERALAVAREQAQSHEAAATRLLREHSDGEECSVVRQLIDRELLP